MARKLVILLIPGHGGNDPGAVNPRFPDADTEEEDINLSVALALREQLRARGHEVLMSRDRDVYISPADQLRLIRETKPDCAIAIHCNSSTNRNSGGIETFYRDADDLELAGAVHEALVMFYAPQLAITLLKIWKGVCEPAPTKPKTEGDI